MLETLETLCRFRGKDNIVTFLRLAPDLVPLLQEACSKIKDYFPTESLVLEVIPDPEAPYEELVLSIQTRREAEDALERLHLFDHDWWLDSCPKADGRLCITLEYI